MTVKGLKIDGLADLQDLFEGIAINEARNLNRSTIHAIAGEVRDEAKKRATKDTGTLKKAIKSKRRRARDPDRPFSDVIVTQGKSARHDAFYWRFLEYGTVNQQARPFIKPAVMDVRPRIAGIYRQKFGVVLERRLRRKAKQSR